MAVLFVGACKYREEERTIGYIGKARAQPFLAAEQILQQLGYDTVLHRRFVMPEYGEVFFTTAEADFSRARARQLMDWVHEGGTLIYCMTGALPYDDFGLFEGRLKDWLALTETHKDPILDMLGVPVERGASETKQIQVRAGSDVWRVAMPGSFRFSGSGKETVMLAGDKDDTLVLGLSHGDGTVYLLSNAEPLRNAHVGERDHADFLVGLVSGNAIKVHFLFTRQSSGLWNLLWRRGWTFLAGLAALLAVWLWAKIPRFGPIRTMVLQPLRRFSEQLVATGRFFWRQKQGLFLLGSASESLRARLFQAHPQFRGASDEVLTTWLAERSHLPEERVRAALTSGGERVTAHFIRQMQDLQTLHLSL